MGSHIQQRGTTREKSHTYLEDQTIRARANRDESDPEKLRRLKYDRARRAARKYGTPEDEGSLNSFMPNVNPNMKLCVYFSLNQRRMEKALGHSEAALFRIVENNTNTVIARVDDKKVILRGIPADISEAQRQLTMNLNQGGAQFKL